MILAWHVDYWDYLGWKDPFASKEHTARQKRLHAAKRVPVLQTPHLLVNRAPVGGAKLKATLAEEGKRAARVRLEGSAKVVGKKLEVTGKVTKLDEAFEWGKSFGVVPVLYRKSAVTECPAGENKGATLKEYFLVLKALAAIAPTGKISAEFDLPAGVALADLGVALLAEDGVTMEVFDCVTVAIAAEPSSAED